MSRLDDLHEHIEKAFGFVAEHEQLMQTTQRPEERQNSEHWIHRHWRYIARWVAEAQAICLRTSSECPQWLVEAEASIPVEMLEEARASLNARQSKHDVRHLELHPDHERYIDVGADVSESTVGAGASHLLSPLEEGSVMYRWDREMLEFAHIGLVLEKTKRMLRQRSVFRSGELRQIGTDIEEAGRRASKLEELVADSPETLLYPTLEPRALDDLRHIAALSERILEALDNLDIEASLGEPSSPLWLEHAEQNMCTLDHYIASACDWMVLGQPGPGLDLSSDTLQ